jgi:biopolymer transport protein ExbD
MTRLIRIALAMVILGFTFQLMADSQKVLKIAITASGQISADGRPTTVEALIPILRELAKNKGEVWYYREAPLADPHPNAMKVLSAIVDNNLPVRLSSKPDYSDSIGR